MHMHVYTHTYLKVKGITQRNDSYYMHSICAYVRMFSRSP